MIDPGEVARYAAVDGSREVQGLISQESCDAADMAAGLWWLHPGEQCDTDIHPDASEIYYVVSGEGILRQEGAQVHQLLVARAIALQCLAVLFGEVEDHRRLIRAGHRVAIAEQVETPDEARARAKAEGKPSSKVLVARQIIRFVTAGTLTEDTLLEPRRANRLAALCELRGRVGIAACDISTGRMELEECEADGVAAALSRLGAREIVAPEDWPDAPYEAIARPPGDFASERGRKRLEELHGVATLDAFGTFSRAMLAAAGGLLAYLDHAGKGTLPFLAPPLRKASGAHVAIDAATRESLEIVATTGGTRAGSLLGAIDRTVTGAGARLLGQDLSAPLMDLPAIEARLGLVQLFHDDAGLRDQLRAALRALPDIGRALGEKGKEFGTTTGRPRRCG